MDIIYTLHFYNTRALLWALTTFAGKGMLGILVVVFFTQENQGIISDKNQLLHFSMLIIMLLGYKESFEKNIVSIIILFTCIFKVMKIPHFILCKYRHAD